VFGPGLDPEPRLRDDAECTLRAEQKPVRVWACAGGGHVECLQPSGRGHRADVLDEIVDVSVLRGEVAAGTRRNPPAERRELVGLRVVPELQVVVGECVVYCRPEHSGLDARAPGLSVDGKQFVELAHRQRDDAGVLAGRPAAAVAVERAPAGKVGFDAADDARAATEGNDGDLLVARPREQLRDGVLVGRSGDDVRRWPERATEPPQEVGVGLAVRVSNPGLPVSRAPVGKRLRRRECGRW